MTENIYNDRIRSAYGGDPREFPIYGLADASRYLKIPIKTLKSWVYGRSYRLRDGSSRWWTPVINLPEADKPLLSFYNLTEIHVLCGIRRIYNVQFRKVRDALKYIETQFEDINHPLATQDFWTDKFELFIDRSGDLICASMSGQKVIKEVVEQYLHRIDRDFDLSPFRLYPFSRDIRMAVNDSERKLPELEAMPKHIVIDPLIAFGRPTIVGTGIATNVIAGRFLAGEQVKLLADDYEIEEAQIQDALLYEGVASRAA